MHGVNTEVFILTVVTIILTTKSGDTNKQLHVR